MRKILIAVDDTKGSRNVLSVFNDFASQPVEVSLLHVERLEGRSMIIDMLSEAEMSTLREMLAGTEHKAKLDKRAESILSFYTKELHLLGQTNVKQIIREGIPAEEILKVAQEEGAELIILGQSSHRGLDRFITGRVAHHVKKGSQVPVVVAKRPLLCEEPYTKKDAYAAVSVTGVVVLIMFVLSMVLR